LAPGIAAAEADSVHTLAPSFQRMPALLQSALVSGWLEVSAASTVEATTKALPKAKIEAIAFMACFTIRLLSLLALTHAASSRDGRDPGQLH
jgi:hypothetical protein